MSTVDYRTFLLNFAELNQPAAKRRALADYAPVGEARQLFHRFSFGSIAIKTDSEQPLDELLECACKELRESLYQPV